MVVEVYKMNSSGDLDISGITDPSTTGSAGERGREAAAPAMPVIDGYAIVADEAFASSHNDEVMLPLQDFLNAREQSIPDPNRGRSSQQRQQESLEDRIATYGSRRSASAPRVLTRLNLARSLLKKDSVHQAGRKELKDLELPWKPVARGKAQ